MLLGVSYRVLRAYALIPSLARVDLLADVSPLFSLKNGDDWCFVEYRDEGRRYRGLDCTVQKKGVAFDMDPDVQSCGDATQTFLGAICTIYSALLHAYVVAPVVRVESIEIECGYTGRARLLPMDALDVATSAEECASKLRSSLMQLLNSLPSWVKEDEQTVRVVQRLGAKKSRRDPDFLNAFDVCIRECRESLDNEFLELPTFSPRRVAPAESPAPPWSPLVSSFFSPLNEAGPQKEGKEALIQRRKGRRVAAAVREKKRKNADNDKDGDVDDDDDEGNVGSDGSFSSSSKRPRDNEAYNGLADLCGTICGFSAHDLPVKQILSSAQVAFHTMRTELEQARRDFHELQNAAAKYFSLPEGDEEQPHALQYLEDLVNANLKKASKPLGLGLKIDLENHDLGLW